MSDIDYQIYDPPNKKRWALVKGGVVENVVIATDDVKDQLAQSIWSGYDAIVLTTGLEQEPGPGWSYDGSTFTPPPEEEPPPE